MPRRITILNGHPMGGGLITELVKAYTEGATARGDEVRVLELSQLKFDSVLHQGYRTIQELEPDLQKAQADIAWAEHFVVAYPTWWGGMPALLKGFFDRAFLPGWGFKFHGPKSLSWDKLLQGRSAHIITTLDTPPWYYRFVWGNPGPRQIKHTILEFCGFSPVKISLFGPVKTASPEKIESWKQRLARCC